ncbi:MAG TPA: S8 family peptidase, partial [Thermoanaerobaculia bacterium]
MRRLWIVLLLLALPAAALAQGGGPTLIKHADSPAAVKDQYIVVLNQGAHGPGAASQIARTHGGEFLHTYTTVLNGFAIRVPAQAAEAIARNPNVAYVEQDQTVSINATQNNPPSWGLDRVDQRNLPLSNSYTFNFDGTGVHAYIIDTGIRASHNDFGGRASADFDAVGDGQNGNDCNGHGTHVAGTVGSATYGIAKNVRLHGVRVLNCSGSGTNAGVIAGIDFVAQNAIDPAVANMSLGGGASTSIDNAVNNAVNSGVFFAVAAGNENQNACNVSPARAANAYTVGSSTISDARSSFSNFGTCVEIFAPGSSITSAWITSNSSTNTISGTSMASPHVAGAAALLLDENPGLSP